MGIAGVYLGVGRNKTEDTVCPDAGFILYNKEGDFVKKGDVIMDIYGKDENCLVPAKELVSKAVSYSQNKPDIKKLVYKEIK